MNDDSDPSRAMLPISQLMDAPADSAGVQLFESHEVSKSVTASESPSFFRHHGLFYQQDAEVGSIVDAVDRLGLCGSPESFKFFIRYILKEPVRPSKSIF